MSHFGQFYGENHEKRMSLRWKKPEGERKKLKMPINIRFVSAFDNIKFSICMKLEKTVS